MAREAHIASLKEELRLRENVINSQREEIRSMITKQQDLLSHLTGANRNQTNGPTNFQSIPRTAPTLFNRIKAAENNRSDPTLTAQRRKEYNDRIDKILQPKAEVEVIEDEIPKSS